MAVRRVVHRRPAVLLSEKVISIFQRATVAHGFQASRDGLPARADVFRAMATAAELEHPIKRQSPSAHGPVIKGNGSEKEEGKDRTPPSTAPGHERQDNGAIVDLVGTDRRGPSD